MAEEVRIVAKFDDTDIQNGVRRSENAAREMKQIWETTRWDTGGRGVGASSGSGGFGAGGFGTSEDMESDFRNRQQRTVASSGEQSDPLKNLVERLLVRDLIYGIISGIATAFKTVQSDLQELSGSIKETGGIFTWMGHTITESIAMWFPGAGAAFEAVQNANTRQRLAGDDRAIAAEKFNQHPEQLTTSLADLQKQLIEVLNQRKDSDAAFGQQAAIAGSLGDTSSLHQIEADRKKRDEELKAEEEWARKMVSIAERRDALELRGDKKGAKADFHSLEATAKAAQFMQEQIEKDAARDAKKAESDRKKQDAYDRRVEAHRISDEIRADEADKVGNKDLSFTEREARKMRATSAVVINGSVFGRNDGIGALVSHAAQTVAELRQIKTEISQLRKERSDLTLL